MADDAEFQPLPARMVGSPLDETLHDGVPDWLAEPLRHWVAKALDSDEELARRIAMRLRWAPSGGRGYAAQLTWCSGDQLLTVVDAILQMNSALWDYVVFLQHRPDINRIDPAQELIGLLADAGSRYTVDIGRHRLTVVLDPTVAAVRDRTIAADPTAGDHLRAAFAAAYGLTPDPDKAYREAVLAVEALTCPLVCPSNPRSTLGRVIADLRSQQGQWALAIGDRNAQPADPGPLIEMVTLLWHGQSRHAGSPNSRRQTPAEAEAAVHLAATLVQWISSGVLYHR